MRWKSLIVGLLVALVVPLGLVGCSLRRPVIDHFLVEIYEEYFEQFDQRGFTFEDFGWENVSVVLYFSDIPYGEWRMFSFILQNTGRQHVDQAVRHFNTLSFVKEAWVPYTVQWRIEEDACYVLSRGSETR